MFFFKTPKALNSVKNFSLVVKQFIINSVELVQNINISLSQQIQTKLTKIVLSLTSTFKSY